MFDQKLSLGFRPAIINGGFTKAEIKIYHFMYQCQFNYFTVVNWLGSLLLQCNPSEQQQLLFTWRREQGRFNNTIQYTMNLTGGHRECIVMRMGTEIKLILSVMIKIFYISDKVCTLKRERAQINFKTTRKVDKL